jgi:hypothetical protein
LADEGKFGTDWDDEELDLIVADYFGMLTTELRREKYNKASHNSRLQGQIRRTKGSIERKHQNVSAVLHELGMPWIIGYKPLPNYQQAILAAIDRYLTTHPVTFALEAPKSGALAQTGGPFLEPPPQLVSPGPALPKPMQRLIRKFDPAERDFRNRKLGRAGEEFVLDFEKRRLHAEGRSDLSRKVRWIADEEGDGAGYDIRSFTSAGAERLLEVKTTCGAQRTPFYLTRNERAVAEERPSTFRLYRLYDFARTPRLFALEPPLERLVYLEPLTFRASFR